MARQPKSGFKNNRFKVNTKKIKHQPFYTRQSVTGVVVNQKRSVPKKLRLNLRAKLHNMKLANQPLDEETKGQLSFIRSINQEHYKKLINIYS